MWNQVGAEIILLIRTYAFFNRNIYVLTTLVSGLSGLVAYQLYVATSQMLRKCDLHDAAQAECSNDHEVLPFVNPSAGPCFPMSKPHSADLLGEPHVVLC